MEYEEIEVEFAGQIQKHIIVNLGNENYKSFPAIESNPEYKEFLKALDDNTNEAE